MGASTMQQIIRAVISSSALRETGSSLVRDAVVVPRPLTQRCTEGSRSFALAAIGYWQIERGGRDQ